MGRGISAGTMGIALVAIVVGLVGAYAVRMSLMTVPEPVVEAPEPQTVPLATTDLPAGRTIALGDIALARMSPSDMSERGFNTSATMMSAQQIIGRTLREPIRAGQPFLTTAMYLEGQRRDFTADLKPGYRAYSMQLPKDRGGALPSGTFVDIVFRSAEQKAEQGKLGIPEVTVRLLEGVEIIDVFDPPPPPPQAGRQGVFDVSNLNTRRVPPPPTVTLAVTPSQADILQTTSGRGEMTLVARPEDERVVAAGKVTPVSLEDVLGIERPLPPPPVVLFATEIYRRGARNVNVFRDDKLIEQLRGDQAAQDNADPMGNVPADNTVPPTPAPLPPAPLPPAPMPPLDPLNPPPAANPPAPAPGAAAPPAPANDNPFADDPVRPAQP